MLSSLLVLDCSVRSNQDANRREASNHLFSYAPLAERLTATSLAFSLLLPMMWSDMRTSL
jgi:hypothetical protein